MSKAMKTIILVILLVAVSSTAYAGAWEFRFFGINYKDFEGRKPIPIIVGCIASFVVHEAGHLIAGRMVGMDTSMRWDRGPVAWAEDYSDKSNSQKALFHGGGFLAQALVGSVLTVMPATRHSDFSLGFTSFTTVNNLGYSITGKSCGREDISDVKNLDNCGYNGTAIALTGGVFSAVLTYINLNKDKEFTFK